MPTTTLPMQGAQVQSLVRELRSHMLWGAATKKKKKSWGGQGQHWLTLHPIPAASSGGRPEARGDSAPETAGTKPREGVSPGQGGEALPCPQCHFSYPDPIQGLSGPGPRGRLGHGILDPCPDPSPHPLDLPHRL